MRAWGWAGPVPSAEPSLPGGAPPPTPGIPPRKNRERPGCAAKGTRLLPWTGSRLWGILRWHLGWCLGRCRRLYATGTSEPSREESAPGVRRTPATFRPSADDYPGRVDWVPGGVCPLPSSVFFFHSLERIFRRPAPERLSGPVLGGSRVGVAGARFGGDDGGAEILLLPGASSFDGHLAGRFGPVLPFREGSGQTPPVCIRVGGFLGGGALVSGGSPMDADQFGGGSGLEHDSPVGGIGKACAFELFGAPCARGFAGLGGGAVLLVQEEPGDGTGGESGGGAVPRAGPGQEDTHDARAVSAALGRGALWVRHVGRGVGVSVREGQVYSRWDCGERV